MGITYNTNIVRDGLVLHLDTINPKSYSGGSNINDLSGNDITCTFNNYTENNDIYNSVALNNDTGRINCSSISNITTIELWFTGKSDASSTYILDMRAGGSGGWIYNGSTGGNWTGGKLYINGEYVELIGGTTTMITVEAAALGTPVQVVFTAVTPATDDITLFSRYSNTESYPVDFYNAKIYNRELAPEEIQQNFEALRGRYGI